MSVELAIRKMLLADVPLVRQLLEEAPEAANWSESAIRASLDDPVAVSFVTIGDRKITGCIFGRNVGREAEILNLAVSLPCRRRGIAKALVQHILKEWQGQDVERVCLEVRESNFAAIRFYQRLGFKQNGRRKRYYTQPEEDALLWEHKLLRK